MDIFREVLTQTRKIVNCEIAVIDRSGLIIASSDKSLEGKMDENINEVYLSNDSYVYLSNRIYGKVVIRNRVEFYGYIDSQNPNDEKLLQMFLINIQNLRKYYKEKFSKEYFIQDLIFNRVSVGDIAIRGKELHVPYNSKRQLYLISSKDTGEAYIQEILRSLFPDKEREFIITIDNKNIVFVKDCSQDMENETKLANTILDTLNAETMEDINIFVGSPSEDLKDLSQSYIDACKAKEIGSIFEGDRKIVNFNSLGLGRLIYELPRELCEVFIKEVFNKDSYGELDDETVRTIVKFFENNLNVSETSRQLYVHRNTLVYRLDKIQKITGLDLRNFEDAIIFKISMMVKRYLDKT